MVSNSANDTSLQAEEGEIDHRSQIAIILQAASLAVIMFSSIFGNILILLAIYINRHLHEITSVFIANLACADLLLAVVGMPFTLTSSITYDWIFGSHWCKINGLSNSAFCIASMLSLAAVSIDRYIAIIKPLKYKLFMTPTTVAMVIIYVWFQSISCALLPVFGWSRYTYIKNESICTGDWRYNISYTLFIFGICFFAPLVVIICSYYHILKTAREHSRRIAASRIGQLGNDSLQTAMAVPTAKRTKGHGPHFSLSLRHNKNESKAKEARYLRDKKAAKTLLIVVGSFLLCWSPHFIGMTCLLFPSCSWPDEFFATTTWLAMMNSGCNPIIYGALNRRFRHSFMNMMCCGRMKKHRVESETAMQLLHGLLYVFLKIK